MKKVILPVMATLFIVAISLSCGSSRHKCPAYGNIEVDQQQNIETIAIEVEEKA